MADKVSKPKGKNGNNRYLILLVIFVAVVCAGWFWYMFAYGSLTIDDAYIDRDKGSISPKMLGKIAKIYVQEGDRVTNGQILIVLDKTTLIAQESQAEAAYNVSLGNIESAKVNLERAQDDYNRADMQFKSSVITVEQYSHAKKALEAAKAAYGVAVSQSTMASAQLSLTKVNLNDSTLVSPFNGIVAKKWLMEGDVAQAGEAILTVNDTDDIWVTANIEEVNLSSFRVGKEVSIHVDAYPGIAFRGKVREIGTDTGSQFSLIPPNNASGNFTKVTQRIPVKISIETVNASERSSVTLLPGMSVEVVIKKRG
jgi:membrane fusion protein (multidrug efflux system)